LLLEAGGREPACEDSERPDDGVVEAGLLG
jgi:hypothetical protein